MHDVNIFVKRLMVSAICEGPVKHYSEVFGLEARVQSFVVVVDFQFMLSCLVEMEDLQCCFCSAEA